jgi:hypothetical protein
LADEDDAAPPEEPEEPEEGEEPETASPADEAPEPDEPEREEAGEQTAGPQADEMLAQIRAIRVGDLLLSTVTTLTSIGYGKLETRELDEARGAIDALRALLPVLEGRVDDGLRRDFERALANLQVAYADATAK